MIELELKNHKIRLSRIGEGFTITPFYKKVSVGDKHFSMGDIVIDRGELASLIVKLNELLHGS